MGLRIGIVGWGEIARDHASHFAANGAELTAVVSRQKNLELDVPVYRDLARMLPHVDALTVAVPNHLHAKLCLEAMKARKPVLVEKPLCINMSQLSGLERAFNNLATPVHLGYRLRWNPSILALKSRIRGLRRVECIYNLGIERLAEGKDWTRRLALSGGSFFTLGVHALDLVRWLADANGSTLTGLRAGATHSDGSTDYPLRVWLSGTLRNGIAVVAGADLRGDAETKIDLRVEAHDGGDDLPAPTLKDEKVEYAALIADFVRAVEVDRVDHAYAEEVLQTHRELLKARHLARSGER